MDLLFTLPPFVIGQSNVWLKNEQIVPGSALVINSIYSEPFFFSVKRNRPSH